VPQPLPVDSFITQITQAVDRSRAAIVTAAPGAGKTTRIPPALIDRGRVLLLQPRRVAARAMAKRIAEEREWAVGNEIGWHIRFDRQFSRNTRLLVVTEGILTAYLQDDPLLTDVATIVVDEFHERSVHADLGLALAKQAWLARSDLRIVVMSATLDPQPVSKFLGGCPVIDVPGTLHPLTIEYAPGQRVADAVRSVLPKTSGNVLCFLPGVREISTAVSECASLRDQQIDVVPLHGSLDADAQDAALSNNVRRRQIIVATNVAETSLTVPGVSAVVDSGLQKIARYDTERGVDALALERITLDSADQRAGRAARLGPGMVIRLWDSRDRLRSHREPEIDRIDLAGPLLAVLAWGASPETFEWFDRPSPDRVAASLALLERIGAVEDGRITAIGRQLQRLPLHPRLGRVLIKAHGSFEGAAACAWLSEPTRIEARGIATSSDLLPMLDRWNQMPPHLKRVAENLQRTIKALLGDQARDRISEEQLRRALLAGYPDRVARRRSSDKATLATGHGAIIGRDSGVHDAEWLLALDVTSGRTGATTEAIIRLASRIEPEWLTPTRSEIIEEIDDGGTVRARTVDWYDNVILRERAIAPSDERRIELLAEAWIADDNSKRLLRRIAFAGLEIDQSALIRQAAQSARTVSDVVLSEDVLPWELRQQLDRLAPGTLTVPSGRDMAIEYGDDGSVSVAVKLQELFGLAETPRIGRAKTPITFHLLAPNRRPVQTTQDLRSFWERTYPEVRKELRGRYPKHPWPEDPWNAPATHRTKPRR
jgi:ATP-dependent helicase HrpB